MFFVMSSDDTPVCPVCGGTLKYRDTRPRIRKKEGGLKEYLMIRRLRCTECHRHHNELPDCLVPHGPYINYHGDSKLSSLKTTHESSLVTAREISNNLLQLHQLFWFTDFLLPKCCHFILYVPKQYSSLF